MMRVDFVVELDGLESGVKFRRLMLDGGFNVLPYRADKQVYHTRRAERLKRITLRYAGQTIRVGQIFRDFKGYSMNYRTLQRDIATLIIMGDVERVEARLGGNSGSYTLVKFKDLV